MSAVLQIIIIPAFSLTLNPVKLTLSAPKQQMFLHFHNILIWASPPERLHRCMKGRTWAYSWCCFCSTGSDTEGAEWVQKQRDGGSFFEQASDKVSLCAYYPFFALFVCLIVSGWCLRGSVWHCANTQRCIIQQFHINECTPCRA